MDAVDFVKAKAIFEVEPDTVVGITLVADILPPPLYLVEAWLEVNLVLDEPERVVEHEARLQQLRSDYEERHTFWTARKLDPALREHLAGDVDAFAARLVELARDAELRKRLGASARAAIGPEFDIDGMVRAQEALYDELLGAARG